MKCPYCLSEIPEAARKCKLCGEWVKCETRQIADQIMTGAGVEFPRYSGHTEELG